MLPAIIEAVGRRMPVLVDSGFRRGTDIIKALAIGAQAVCIGRPYLWASVHWVRRVSSASLRSFDPRTLCRCKAHGHVGRPDRAEVGPRIAGSGWGERGGPALPTGAKCALLWR
jgi:hypothetical protein